jgi:N-acetylneuraminate synthase/N,N'-diacetyllegionaminate synthase
VTETRTLFAILARGGSKRLPGKNLLEVGGVPLVGRAVRTARLAATRLGNPARVVASTDDETLARVARDWGAETPFLRPPLLATDAASSVDTLRHLVDWLAERGDTFNEVVLVQPTSPLSTAADVLEAVRLFRSDPQGTVVTVRPAAHAGAGLSFVFKDGRLTSAGTAATAELVELNGAVYVCGCEWLREHERLCEPSLTRAVLMPLERSVDVDTLADIEAAKALWAQGLLWRPNRCFVIAEAGVNHNGDINTAKDMIEAAADTGADAIKFQTYSADRLVSRHAPKAAYQQDSTSNAESHQDMLKKLELSADDHRALMKHCQESGIMFLSSAFGEADVDLLDSMDVAAIKIGSGEITNHPLLEYAASTGRPIILSTGASTLGEIDEAIRALRRGDCAELALLHCVSSYPTEASDVNLRAMDTLTRTFGLPVGFSDHTEGIDIATAAAALGARIIEKHFTLDQAMPGPDHAVSLEPTAFQFMVEAVRRVEEALGDGIKRPLHCEADVRRVARRSLVATADLTAGEIIRKEHLTAKRPGTGIAPWEREKVVGRRLCRDLALDEPLTWAHLREKDLPA